LLVASNTVNEVSTLLMLQAILGVLNFFPAAAAGVRALLQTPVTVNSYNNNNNNNNNASPGSGGECGMTFVQHTCAQYASA